MVPKMETPGLRGPASAGSACVPGDLRTNPKTTAAIPSGIVRPPSWTNTLPTPTHVAFGGNVRPPTWGEGSLPIAAKIVRRTRGFRCLTTVLDAPGGPPPPAPAGSAWCRTAASHARRRLEAPIAGVWREPMMALTKNRFEGDEREQRHLRSP